MFDSEQEIALGYLAHQFPEDYPEDKEEKPKVKGPSKEELDKQEHDQILKYAAQVTDEAADYQQSLVQAKIDKEEQIKLSRMGMEGEPVALQLKDRVRLQKKAPLQVTLLQVSSDLHEIDENAAIAQAYLEQQFPDDFPTEKP